VSISRLTDVHRNCFVYYRGPSAGSDARVRQIEDNSTKALINLLEHSERSLTGRFLKEMLEVDEPVRDASYFLQGGGAPDQTPCVLLGIAAPSVVTDDEAPVVAAAEGGSRIDASILVPGLRVIIEVKTVGSLDDSQLARHQEKWNATSIVRRRWVDVFQWAQRELATSRDDVTGFLLRQFVEYLQITGLSAFAGFTEADFDPEDDLERSAAKARLKQAWDAIFEKLSSDDRRALGNGVHANRISKHEWPRAQTNHLQSGANLVVALRAAGVEPHLAAWKADAASKFVGWLRTPDAAPLLTSLRGYHLAVVARRPHGYDRREAGARPWWQRTTFDQFWMEDCAAMDADRIGELLEKIGSLDRKWEKPAFNLARVIPRDDAIGQGAAIVEHLTADVHALLPILTSVNRLASP
jgi:hypothetical protein